MRDKPLTGFTINWFWFGQPGLIFMVLPYRNPVIPPGTGLA